MKYNKLTKKEIKKILKKRMEENKENIPTNWKNNNFEKFYDKDIWIVSDSVSYPNEK